MISATNLLCYRITALDLVYMVDLKLSTSRWREEYRMSNSSQFQNLALEIEQGVFFSFNFVLFKRIIQLFIVSLDLDTGTDHRGPAQSV